MTEHEALAVRLGHMSKWFTDQSYEATTLREAQAALAATPAVGGEIETAFLNLCEALGLQATPLAYLDAVAARAMLAAQPASPLRGREYLAPSPCSDLSIGELIEWLDNPQWTNGYLNSDAANHMSAAAELIERLVSSAPPEQPAAWQCHAKLRPEVSDCMWPDCGCEPRSTEIIAALVKQGWTPPQPAAAPATKLDEAIEEAAKIAQPWTGFWLDEYSTDADRAVVAVRVEIAEKIRALKSSTAPAKSSSGEPIREDNHMSNDLDKGDDA